MVARPSPTTNIVIKRQVIIFLLGRLYLTGAMWIPDAGNETTFIVTGLTNELYTFQVRAVNSVEGGTSASEEVTPSDLAVPENFQVTVSPKVLTFSWDIDSAKTQPHHHVLMVSFDEGTNFERASGFENIQSSPLLFLSLLRPIRSIGLALIISYRLAVRMSLPARNPILINLV